MPGLPDVGDLDALADRITGHAVATRARAARLRSAVAATGWCGPAAAAFGAEADSAIAGLVTAAVRLDDAADALRRHARRVDAVMGEIVRLGVDELGFCHDALFDPEQLPGDAGRLVGDGVRMLDSAVGLLGF